MEGLFLLLFAHAEEQGRGTAVKAARALRQLTPHA